MSGDVPETVVVENARLELLRMLALWREVSATKGPNWPRLVPLFEGEWGNSREDIILAAREANRLDQIEMHVCNDPAGRIVAALHGGFEAMVGITDSGYDWIKARDAAGEAAQESV